MREHTMENDIYDEEKLGAVANVSYTFDQLIIDWSIIEEVKIYNQNLAVTFYDYKEAYDKIQHHWMLRLYKGIRIPGHVITLRSFRMRKWKTRLEIWKDGKKYL